MTVIGLEGLRACLAVRLLVHGGTERLWRGLEGYVSCCACVVYIGLVGDVDVPLDAAAADWRACLVQHAHLRSMRL